MELNVFENGQVIAKEVPTYEDRTGQLKTVPPMVSITMRDQHGEPFVVHTLPENLSNREQVMPAVVEAFYNHCAAVM